MKPKCPRLNCFQADSNQNLSPTPGTGVQKRGRYYRKSDSRWIDRFKCTRCGADFSRATFQATYRQKKRRVNEPLRKLLCSGVSQRRAAKLLGIDCKTVARKLKFLAKIARLEQANYLAHKYRANSVQIIQFDDLETSEHSKCKPLSVALAVEPKERKILSFHVSRMPAKGLLTHIARKKYGPRPDERPKGWSRMMKDLEQIVCPSALTTFTSDQNPHYPKFVERHFPNARHETTPGRRGCIAGQGELKVGGFDPLFSLNHSCAMLRANINRLFRRTWCTTKRTQGLLDHLAIYINFHNRVLTSEGAA